MGSTGHAAAVVAISDGRSGTDEAVKSAATVAACADAPLHIIHALDIIGQPLPEALSTLASLKYIIEHADEALRDQLQRSAPGVQAGARVIAHHNVTEALLRYAREQRLSMIVSVPEMLRDPQARPAECAPFVIAELTRSPVMIVKRPLCTRSGRVLIALDSSGTDEATVHTMIECIMAVHEAGITPTEQHGSVIGDGGGRPSLQVELVYTALDPAECTGEERVRWHTSLWARALAEHGEAPPRWSVAWSEQPGRHLRRRAADPDLDLLLLHRTQATAPFQYDVLDNVLASALDVASCPVLAHPSRVRTPLRPGSGLEGDREPPNALLSPGVMTVPA